MTSFHRAVFLSALTGSLALGATIARADDASSGATAGVWQKHDYRFQFMGFTTTYSCDGLADKLSLLLKYAGARNDVKAYPGACASSYGRPDTLASANLTFYTLATPTGDPDEKQVQGVWRSVNIAARSPRDLSAGDCELVEQFRSNVLPMFSARNVDSHTTCIPHQLSGSSIDLKFDALALPPSLKK